MLAHSRLSAHKRLVEQTSEAIEQALDSVTPWYVSVSGGKDSTALLHLVVSVAGTIDAVHHEDEIIAPGTVEYVETLGQWAGVRLIRTAAPIRHSDEHTAWRDKPWLRPLPPGTCWFSTRAEQLAWYQSQWMGGFVGTRREESAVREISYRVNGAHYYATTRGWWVNTSLHRWRLTDVWAYLLSHDIPYHPGYDVMTAAGVPRDRQRIGPPTNVRALTGSSMAWLRMGWPQYYEDVCQRFPRLRGYA